MRRQKTQLVRGNVWKIETITLKKHPCSSIFFCQQMTQTLYFSWKIVENLLCNKCKWLMPVLLEFSLRYLFSSAIQNCYVRYNSLEFLRPKDHSKYYLKYDWNILSFYLLQWLPDNSYLDFVFKLLW